MSKLCVRELCVGVGACVCVSELSVNCVYVRVLCVSNMYVCV